MGEIFQSVVKSPVISMVEVKLRVFPTTAFQPVMCRRDCNELQVTLIHQKVLSCLPLLRMISKSTWTRLPSRTRLPT